MRFERLSCESVGALKELEAILKPVQRQAIQEPIWIGHGGKSRPRVNFNLSGRIKRAPRKGKAMPRRQD